MMDTAQATRSHHRTFARTNGLGGFAVPRLVAAEERHRKNLEHIRQLKVALCSTVSSAAPHQPPTPALPADSLPSSSSASLPSPALPAWGEPRDHSTGIVASPTTSAVPQNGVQRQHAQQQQQRQEAAPLPPPAVRETLVSAAVLRSSQQEVEQLVREKHELQRQCIELASLLANGSHGDAASGLVAAAPATAHETSNWIAVRDAAVAVVEQVSRCYPSVVQNWVPAKPANDAAQRERTAESSRDSATSSLAVSARDPHTSAWCEGSRLVDVEDVTADELAGVLQRLAEFLPQLASMTTVSELVAQAGPDVLDHIRVLEEEKRSDCLAVLSITDHLTKVSAQLRREAAEKDLALQTMQRAVEELMEEKQEWSRRARASEAALAERYAQYRQREKAWESEMAELQQSRGTAAVAVTAATAQVLRPAVEKAVPNEEDAAEAARMSEEEEERKGQLARLQEELDQKDAALGSLREEHAALQSTHAALQASSQERATAQQERIAVLERQLSPLEAELKTQAGIIQATLQKVDELTTAHRAEVATLHEVHRVALQEKEAAVEELRAAKQHAEAELADAVATVAQRTTELETVTAARDAARVALEERDKISVADSSAVAVGASTPLRLPHLAPDSAGVDRNRDTFADDGEAGASPSQADEEGNEESTDFMSRCTNVRKLQQSLKRMSRERAALKRKLEHRGAALTTMEAELEEAQRLVAQQEARIQVLQAEMGRAGVSAVLGSGVVSESAQTVSVLPINWITFCELELHEEVDTLYPAPVDLSGWLQDGKAPVRFADYVVQHLDHHDQLLIDAVGPLYHVGFHLLKAEGLLGDGSYYPMVWRRFFVQLQQVLDAQRDSPSVSPADSALCFYTLASAAGLFTGPKSANDLLAAYTLVVASLCVCLHPRDAETTACDVTPGFNVEEEQKAHPSVAADTSRQSEVGGCAAKWRCCQAILRHVCGQGDGEDEATRQRHPLVAVGDDAPFALLTRLAQQDCAAASCSFAAANGCDSCAPPREARHDTQSDEAAAPSTCSLASLLSSGLLCEAQPLSCFSLRMMALQQAVEKRREISDGAQGAGSATERGLFAPTTASRQHKLVTLLLYLSRHEYLLSGWQSRKAALAVKEGAKKMDTSASFLPLPSFAALGVDRHITSSRAKDDTRAQSEVEDVVEALLFLDTCLLPAATLSICLCRSLEHEPQLLAACFETRRALVEKHRELLSHGAFQSLVSPAELCPGVPLLLEAQLREHIQQVLAQAKPTPPLSSRVVQVPAAEYERLHCELLSLYQTNEKYDAYIQELLGAAEAV